MRSDHRYQVVDGQTDFSGGMRQIGELEENQYRYGENIVIRDGNASTRFGVRRAFRVLTDGFDRGFFFNEENARLNDATHTGFWFPFSFVSKTFGTIQGTHFFRFLEDNNTRQIIIAGGVAYVHDRGFIDTVPIADTIASDETINFVQGNNKLVLFRDGGKQPLYWDGANQSAGFVTFTDPGTTNRIPKGANGSYMFGRLWVISDRDDLYASDALDFDTYDFVEQLFSVGRGDGDEIVQVVPYKESWGLVFKKRSVWAIGGANQHIDTGSGETLATHVYVENVTPDFGMVGPQAYAIHGEQITFLSYKGITSIARTQEGKLRGAEIPLSAAIRPLMERINWQAAECACGTFYDNYLLFAVPMDGATSNTHVLVYDLTANGGQGAWVGLWTGQLLKPVEFFAEEENLYFLGTDGAMRTLFTNDPWDSEDIDVDTPLYDNSVTYKVGDRVRYDKGGDDQDYYTCILEATGVAVTDTTYFTPVTDPTPETLYHVDSKISTRFLKHGDEASPKRYSRCQILFDHADPKLSVDIEDEDFGTLVNLFSDQTYSQVAYDVAGTDDWVSTNENDDFQTPNRQDYTLFLRDDELYVYANGVNADVLETHALRFIPRVQNNTAFGLQISNTQGKLIIKSIISQAQQSLFAKRDR